MAPVSTRSWGVEGKNLRSGTEEVARMGGAWLRGVYPPGPRDPFPRLRSASNNMPEDVEDDMADEEEELEEDEPELDDAELDEADLEGDDEFDEDLVDDDDDLVDEEAEGEIEEEAAD